MKNLLIWNSSAPHFVGSTTSQSCSRGTPWYVDEEHALELLYIDLEIIVSCLQLCWNNWFTRSSTSNMTLPLGSIWINASSGIPIYQSTFLSVIIGRLRDPCENTYYPLVNVYITMEKSPFLMGQPTINGQFSITMFVYQRVCILSIAILIEQLWFLSSIRWGDHSNILGDHLVFLTKTSWNNTMFSTVNLR